jgi:hypothetical protein
MRANDQKLNNNKYKAPYFHQIALSFAITKAMILYRGVIINNTV